MENFRDPQHEVHFNKTRCYKNIVIGSLFLWVITHIALIIVLSISDVFPYVYYLFFVLVPGSLLVLLYSLYATNWRVRRQFLCLVAALAVLVIPLVYYGLDFGYYSLSEAIFFVYIVLTVLFVFILLIHVLVGYFARKLSPLSRFLIFVGVAFLFYFLFNGYFFYYKNIIYSLNNAASVI